MFPNVNVPSFKNVDIITIFKKFEYYNKDWVQYRAIYNLFKHTNVLNVENKGWKYFHSELGLVIEFGQTMKFTNQWMFIIELVPCC